MDSDPHVTAAERDVLRLVARGLSNKAIAAELSVTPDTVHTHLAHLYDKFGMHGRGPLVAAALKRGLVRTDDL